MYYDDDEAYAVEIGDQVIVLNVLNEPRLEGEITKILPRKMCVKVDYEDHIHCYRTTGNPRKGSEIVPISDVQLVVRSM